MKLIVAVAKDWGIGKDGQLLARNKEDMRFFRETTTGHVVIMGRKTLESFPNRQPLKNRDNIVITANEDFVREGAYIVHSIEEAIKKAKECAKGVKDIFVIGGESIYRQMLSYCDTAYVTKMNQIYPADNYFPNLDDYSDWELRELSEEHTYPDGQFVFCTYIRRMGEGSTE